MKEQIQRDILYEVCKAVATNKRTPDWIKAQIYQAVKKAQEVKEEFPELDNKEPVEQRPIQVGDKAYSDTLDGVGYLFQVLAEKEEIDGVRLFDVKVIAGKGPHRIGATVFNMPETWLSLRS